MVLEQIQDESWDELSVLSGNAEHVPSAVLGLLSTNKVYFEKSYWKLDNYVVVQGDLFSAAALLPKYLEEVVIKAKYKEQVIDLIWQIGSGYSENTLLQETCYSEAMKALENLKIKFKLSGSKYLKVIEGEIKELQDLKVDQDKNT